MRVYNVKKGETYVRFVYFRNMPLLYLVLLGLIRCMQEALLRGEVVQLGALGNFRLSLGSSGVVNADDFHASLIRKPRIIYSPGVKLREMIAKVSIERIGQETDKSNAGGEDDRPGEL